VVLTPEEVRAVLQQLEGSDALVAGLLYGSGLRLMEAHRLRVHDLDFKRRDLSEGWGRVVPRWNGAGNGSSLNNAGPQ
jgi:integrase